MTLSPSTFRWLAISWTIILFIGCAIPGNEMPDLSHGRDKWIHLVGFAPFGLLWCFSGRRQSWVLVAGLVFGLLIEIYQGVMPIGRSFDLLDALADTVGTALGIGLFMGIRRLGWQ